MTTLPTLFNPIALHSEPFSALDRLLDEVTGQVWKAQNDYSTFNGGSFPIDVEENEKEYVLTADLPSVKREEIDISMEGNRITISVKQERGDENKAANYIHRERRVYRSARTVQLEAASKAEDVKAELKDGVLSVRVKKDESVLPKRIAIS